MGKKTADLYEYSNYFKLPEFSVPQDYNLLIGFAGYGNVGYLIANHMVEDLEVETIATWGNTTWFYNGQLESLLTLYAHHKSKTLILTSRFPVSVTSIPHENWEELALEVLSWNCKAYYILGGLREETRTNNSDKWYVFAPTKKYIETYHLDLSLDEKLTMIGPLSAFLSLGTSLKVPVLGILFYCNFEEDPEASLLGLGVIKDLLQIDDLSVDSLKFFDFSFIPPQPVNEVNVGQLNNLSQNQFSDENEDDNDDDHLDFGLDMDDLL